MRLNKTIRNQMRLNKTIRRGRALTSLKNPRSIVAETDILADHIEREFFLPRHSATIWSLSPSHTQTDR